MAHHGPNDLSDDIHASFWAKDATENGRQPFEVDDGGNQQALNTHFGQTATPRPAETMPLLPLGKDPLDHRRSRRIQPLEIIRLTIRT